MKKNYLLLLFFAPFITFAEPSNSAFVPPVAEFSANTNTVCVDQTVTFTDQSTESPTSWAWSFLPTTITFQNGTDATSQNPQVSFDAIGEYTVTLMATNSDGTHSVSKSQYVVGTSVVPLLEDFTASAPPSGWPIVNHDGNKTWEAITTKGSNGNDTQVIYINNYNYSASGQLDELVIPSMDLSGVVNPTLYFDIAYAQYNNGNAERLYIEYSTDCGETFNITSYDKSSTVLATVADQTSYWSPATAADWRTESLDLSGYVSSQTILRFVQVNDYGNNLFIDNIRIGESGTLSIEEVSKANDIKVYPNPSNGKFQIKISEAFNDATVKVMDIHGRLLLSKTLNDLNGYEQQELDLTAFSAGNYFLNFTSGKKSYVKKVVIE